MSYGGNSFRGPRPMGGDPNARRLNTPRGQMSMSTKLGPALGMLPPDLKPMFDPRPPIKYLPPGIGGPNDAPELKKRKKVAPKPSPLFECLKLKDKGPNPPVEHFEPPKERKKRLKLEKNEKNKELMEKGAEQNYLPHENESATKDGYKTLFVARLSYETSEKKLWREFESFGQIVSIHVIHNREGAPRGYAFIEFERDEDMRQAYKQADGRKIDGHRVLVDVERGRTVRNWRPRRFGGGIGDTRRSRISKQEEKDRARLEAIKRAQGGDGSAGVSSYASSGGGRAGGGKDHGRYGGDRSGGRDDSGGGRYSGDRGDRSRDQYGSSRGSSGSNVGGHYGGGGGGSGRNGSSSGGGDRDRDYYGGGSRYSSGGGGGYRR
eukprot:352225_1